MQLRGCGTALVTPFHQDGSIDDTALRNLVSWQIESGIDFLVPCGTTGETPTLTRDEWLHVIDTTIEVAAGSVPIIVSPDGRVFANFGGGFEQVVTACGMSNGIVVTNAQSAGLVQPTVVQPTVSQPGIVAGPLPFTPAVPNQQTASQQMLGQAAVPVQGQQQIVVANRACWSTDGRGQVFVGRQ